MKNLTYQEYQVWFHAYNNAVGAFGQIPDDVQKVIEKADRVAQHALDAYKTVKQPEAPDIDTSNIDIQGIVNSVATTMAQAQKK